jgi:hypothetical protein
MRVISKVPCGMPVICRFINRVSFDVCYDNVNSPRPEP